MGFSLSWVAVRGRHASDVLADLGLCRTGEFEELPESLMTGAALPGGWYVVVVNRFNFIDDVRLDRLSIGAEVVTCAVEEHVMISAASGWSNARQQWSVRHEAERDRRHLETAGDLPPDFAAIRERLFGKQDAVGRKANVDYIFDVPVQLAGALTGFRHYDIPEDGAARFGRLTK